MRAHNVHLSSRIKGINKASAVIVKNEKKQGARVAQGQAPHLFAWACGWPRRNLDLLESYAARRWRNKRRVFTANGSSSAPASNVNVAGSGTAATSETVVPTRISSSS